MRIADLANSIAEQRPEEDKIKGQVTRAWIGGVGFFLLAIGSFILSIHFGGIVVVKGCVHLVISLRFFSRLAKLKKRLKELELNKDARLLLSGKELDVAERIHKSIIAATKTASAVDDLILLIRGLSKSKNALVDLDNNYRVCFGSTLIDDLKEVSDSYETIEKVLSEFVRFEIVKPKYPHAYVRGVE